MYFGGRLLRGGGNNSSVNTGENTGNSSEEVANEEGYISTNTDSVFPVEDGFQYGFSDRGVVIVGYTGEGGDIEIPSELGGGTVVAIGGSAFSGDDSMYDAFLLSGWRDYCEVFHGAVALIMHPFICVQSCLYYSFRG